MDFAEHLRKSDVSENSKVIRLLAENTNFHVHFWLLLSKRALQGLFEKKGNSFLTRVPLLYLLKT